MLHLDVHLGTWSRKRKMCGRILIVDDVATNRIIYQSRLAAACYDPIVAADGQGCLDAALTSQSSARPDLILLDLQLPDISGHEVLCRLRSDARARDLPVIVLTGVQDLGARLAALAAGADDVMVKPVPDSLLLARVRNLMRHRSEARPEGDLSDAGFAEATVPFDPPGTLALVLAPTGPARNLQAALKGQLRDRLVLVSRTEVLGDMARTAEPADVYLIDTGEGGSDAALRLLSELKSHHSTRTAAVCLVERTGRAETSAIAFDLGADDVLGPDAPLPELAARLRNLVRRKRAADRRRARMQDSLRLALVDPLTGLFNRRHAMPQLAAISDRAARSGHPFAVMLLDLDRFKLVNDQHGHAAGDAVLVEVSRRLALALGDGDLLARFGGEEFLIVLPESTDMHARRVAEKLCAAVESPPICLPTGARLSVTVSIGVAASGGRCDVGAVLDDADAALRASKSAGRNQVTFWLGAA